MNQKILERRQAQRAEELNTKFLVGVDVVAEVLGISERSVFRMRKQGMPCRGRGKYWLPDVCWWAFERAKQEPAQPHEPTPYDLLHIAQREKCELEIQQKRASLMPADLVRDVLGQMVEIIGTELEALADVAGDIAPLTDPTQVQALLFTRSRAARRSIASRLLALADGVEW